MVGKVYIEAQVERCSTSYTKKLVVGHPCEMRLSSHATKSKMHGNGTCTFGLVLRIRMERTTSWCFVFVDLVNMLGLADVINIKLI